MRKLISIRIDPKTYQTAREMGLNISKTCENSLKQQIQLLTTSEHQKQGILTCNSTRRQQSWWGCPDLNRGPESPSLRA